MIKEFASVNGRRFTQMDPEHRSKYLTRRGSQAVSISRGTAMVRLSPKGFTRRTTRLWGYRLGTQMETNGMKESALDGGRWEFGLIGIRRANSWQKESGKAGGLGRVIAEKRNGRRAWQT